MREDAALRAQLGAHVATVPERRGTLSPTARRRVGRAITTALVAAAFALGMRYGEATQREWRRGVDDGSETRARSEAPASPTARP